MYPSITALSLSLLSLYLPAESLSNTLLDYYLKETITTTTPYQFVGLKTNFLGEAGANAKGATGGSGSGTGAIGGNAATGGNAGAGGIGGSGITDTAGMNGTVGTNAGGGGGGGGQSGRGGNGGNSVGNNNDGPGGGGGQAGSAGILTVGTIMSSINGGNGGNGATVSTIPSGGGGGGGGGGHGLFLENGGMINLPFSVSIIGGTGGNGGMGQLSVGSGHGGDGGNGGNGMTNNNNLFSLFSDGIITGGQGGMGARGTLSNGRNGNGGNGILLVNGSGSIVLTASSRVSGGRGGAIGPGSGGNGGNGGNGIEATNVVLQNAGLVQGGMGGLGGSNPGGGGGGGIGGNGFLITNSTLMMTTNTGSISGGVGGAGIPNYNGGNGGNAVVGSNLYFIHAGTSLAGGAGGRAGTRASVAGLAGNALVFTAGVNSFELQVPENTITGNVIAVLGGRDTLLLGGNLATNSFDVSHIGSQYQNFSQFAKTGTGLWMLIGTINATTSWAINEGVLQVGDNASLGNDTSAVSLNGGLLETSFATTARQITINEAGGSIQTDAPLSLSASNQLLGTGDFNKTGLSPLIINGDNYTSYIGRTIVQAGSLVVNGAVGGSLDVTKNGLLAGTGMVGSTTVDGTIAPGNSIGTLTVAGNYIQQPGSIYQLEIDPQGHSDRIAVTGKTTLNGGIVQIHKAYGIYQPTRYTILTTDQGFLGANRYEALTQDMPLLDLTLFYTDNAVYLDVAVTNNPFIFFTKTANQAAVAANVEGLGLGNPIYDAIINSASVASLEQALNRLSGELYPSTVATLFEESRYLREAVLSHLTVNNDHLFKLADDVNAWIHGFDSTGRLEGDANASMLNRRSQGFFVGTDYDFSQGRAGMVAGYSHSRYAIDTLKSISTNDSYHLGAYADTHVAKTHVSSGIAYTWHRLDTTRNVTLSTFSNQLIDNYHADNAQVFVDLGYLIPVKSVVFEPMISAAYLTIYANHHDEQGGRAALNVATTHQALAYTTLGMREHSLDYQAAQFTLKQHIFLGWRHAYDHGLPNARLAFGVASQPFTITGTTLAHDALLIDAGVDLLTSNSLQLQLGYLGQFGSRVQDNGITARLSWQLA